MPTGDDREDEGEFDFPEITTTDQFHEALQALVDSADRNDVDVRGGWPVTGADGSVAWDVEIAALQHRSKSRIEHGADPVVAVLEAVAERKGVDTTELPPIYDAVDPELLGLISGSFGEGSHRQVTFQYCGYRITVRADGSVVIDE